MLVYSTPQDPMLDYSTTTRDGRACIDDPTRWMCSDLSCRGFTISGRAPRCPICNKPRPAGDPLWCRRTEKGNNQTFLVRHTDWMCPKWDCVNARQPLSKYWWRCTSCGSKQPLTDPSWVRRPPSTEPPPVPAPAKAATATAPTTTASAEIAAVSLSGSDTSDEDTDNDDYERLRFLYHA